MTASTEVNSTLKMYGKMLTFTRIKLETANLSEIEAYLADTLSNKSSQIPVIIDSDVEQDLDSLVDLFWSWGLQPIGVVTGILDEAAKALRLAIFPGDGKRIELLRPSKKQSTVASTAVPNSSQGHDPKEAPLKTEAPAKEQNGIAETVVTSESNRNGSGSDFIEADAMTTLFYDQMLRSGQSINHVGGDLVLTDSVNNGAEAITDNSLHVYGRAQGRLVAGATGDKDARIFCQRFNPSLVSVAGTYCLNDNIPAEMIDKPVQVRFVEGQGLVFEIIKES
ncbi:septum site-determining protein MinC [Psychrobacter sanguinis]|uniref:septum site-determining protein MinC n=1 Tax=Psychrobacter sanguinis TaxID=861445 RepID=UPI00191AA2F1|nr:septum site-determining protein MinC [Psychrobacter sanguinis]MCC3309322.1 septum site-determining protein MinC [Psychrobacter sanguinis]UEC26593.1 septum site-determining protein MinC [Psychrobacter sanguinis]